jgi:mono/diheme cytochrome c family protein
LHHGLERKFHVRILNAAVALVLFSVAGVVSAAELGDPQRGLVFAKKVCAECHAVEAGEKVSPNIMAPSFDAIAETPGMTDRALIVWLQSSDHATMPNLMIASGDVDNVVAYIMSLRARN